MDGPDDGLLSLRLGGEDGPSDGFVDGVSLRLGAEDDDGLSKKALHSF
jgi:hypothetical protein